MQFNQNICTEIVRIILEILHTQCLLFRMVSSCVLFTLHNALTGSIRNDNADVALQILKEMKTFF